MININHSKGVIVDSQGSALILNCTDTPLAHWAARINDLDVIINVNQCNTTPEIVIRNGKIFIGTEQAIYVIDQNKKNIEHKISNLANIQWIDEGSSDHIVFAAEDEVVTLDNEGNLLWKINLPDVIATTNILSGQLYITDMAGNEFKFGLIDGK